jgi:ketosteroid isomerase-like protein
MASEDVELLVRATAAYNDRDVERMLDHWAPDAVLDWSRSEGPDARIYRGRAEIVEFARAFLDAWDMARIELIDGPVEVEPGVLVVENVTHLRGRAGIAVQARSAWLITISGGAQTSLTLFQTRKEALEAAEPQP